MRVWSAVVFVVGLASALSAQTTGQPVDTSTLEAPQPARRPPQLPRQHFAWRGFALIAEEAFTANTTFDGIFGTSAGLFAGGGAGIVLPQGIFFDVSISRFSKTGERAFRADDETFQLGIPLTSTLTPIELAAGYRLRMRRHPGIVPYGGAGIGTYAYKETSDFVDDVSVRHVGYLVTGGVEVRLQRWIAVDVGGQFTRIPGILGRDGLSKDAGEDDLGGTALRIKFSVGR